MAHSDKPHRSRTAWPAPLEIAGVGDGHTHPISRRWRRIFAALMVLTVAQTLAIGALLWLVLLSEEYRQEQRARTLAAICDVLESLPPGPVLDDVRRRWDCGPGRPVAAFPPQVQQELAERDGEPPVQEPPPQAAEVTPAPAAPPAPPTSAHPAPPPETTGPPAEVPEPGPPPAPPPAPSPPSEPLKPVTDLLCELVTVCVGGRTP